MYAFKAKVIRILLAKFHCTRLTTVHDILDYASLIFLAHSVYITASQDLTVECS